MSNGSDGNNSAVLDDAQSVLLVAPTVTDAAPGAVGTLVDRGPASLDRLVGVTATRSAGSWLRAWDRHTGPATQVDRVDVESETRSAAGTDGGRAVEPFDRVSDPTRLEALGRTVSDALERGVDRGERVGLAVHSLSDLLCHVDERTAFKFVYTLTEIVRRVDGVAYFHLDCDGHDDETVETFTAACDAVVEVDDDVTVTAGGA